MMILNASYMNVKSEIKIISARLNETVESIIIIKKSDPKNFIAGKVWKDSPIHSFRSYCIK